MPAISSPEQITRAYGITMKLCSPIIRRWAQLEVEGLEHMPASGPVLLAGNHDSYWDPIAIGVAAFPRRQIRALAKSSLWKIRGLDRVLDGMGQIPIERGSGDQNAMGRAIEELRAGACIGIFPEGTRSLGRELRARSGFGRMASGVPEAEVVCVAVSGTVDIPRFPKRPHVRVKFFSPAGGGLAQGEEAAALAVRLLTEIRGYAPIAVAGRKRREAVS
ncbi:MAG TPA: lysophospholipid acyltransferase family protein [Thermoleophilaceae bacterium]|jgi:1-acyl-sn-glycerol-3-phosphate acyltransferase